MPTFRRPKGTYVRTTRDWFYRDMAIGTADHFHAPPFAYDFVSLFNNDKPGRSYFIEQLSVFTDASFYGFAISVKGPFGTLVGPCTPLSPDFPAPSGEMYSGQQATQVTGDVVGGYNIGQLGEAYQPTQPLIVPPGYSLIFAGNNNNGLALFATVLFRIGRLD